MIIEIKEIREAMKRNAVFAAMMSSPFAAEVAETLKDIQFLDVPQDQKTITIKVTYNGLEGPAELINEFLQDQYKRMGEKLEAKYSDVELEIQKRVEQKVYEALSVQKKAVSDKIFALKEKLDEIEYNLECLE